MQRRGDAVSDERGAALLESLGPPGWPRTVKMLRVLAESAFEGLMMIARGASAVVIAALGAVAILAVAISGRVVAIPLSICVRAAVKWWPRLRPAGKRREDGHDD